jgi:anthranilate synthase component 2
MILLVDNYDSFSYNLYQLIGSIQTDIKVVRNDELTVREIEVLSPEHIILSPGPGKPADAGICVDIVKKLGGKIPVFGVCLGHQSICEAYGARISYAKELMHGKTSEVTLKENSLLFKGMPQVIKAGRYHSLAALEETLPDELEVTARTQDREIMAVQHKEYKVYGVQFHPESILTPQGHQILKNFLKG